MRVNRNRTARHSRSSKFPSMKGAITDRQTLSLRVSWRLRSRHPPPSTAFFAAFFSPLTSLFSAPLSAVAQPFFFVFFAANVCVSTRECALTAFVSHFYVRHDFFFSPFSTAASFFWPAFFYALFSALCAALFTLSLPPSWSASFFMPFSALYFATVVSNFFSSLFLSKTTTTSMTVRLFEADIVVHHQPIKKTQDAKNEINVRRRRLGKEMMGKKKVEKHLFLSGKQSSFSC